MPEKLEAGGRFYAFRRLYKHDFFAATALYEQVTPDDSPSNHSRTSSAPTACTQSFFGLPMGWLGRFVARHEIQIYQKLQGIPGIPSFLGTVGKNGFLHAFVPGRELSAAVALEPDFFDRLHELFTSIHTLNIAYVDANKRENILVGDDGRPYLIDFPDFVEYF